MPPGKPSLVFRIAGTGTFAPEGLLVPRAGYPSAMTRGMPVVAGGRTRPADH
jgi:hypothetical protein